MSKIGFVGELEPSGSPLRNYIEAGQSGPIGAPQISYSNNVALVPGDIVQVSVSVLSGVMEYEPTYFAFDADILAEDWQLVSETRSNIYAGIGAESVDSGGQNINTRIYVGRVKTAYNGIMRARPAYALQPNNEVNTGWSITAVKLKNVDYESPVAKVNSGRTQFTLLVNSGVFCDATTAPLFGAPYTITNTASSVCNSIMSVFTGRHIQSPNQQTAAYNNVTGAPVIVNQPGSGLFVCSLTQLITLDQATTGAVTTSFDAKSNSDEFVVRCQNPDRDAYAHIEYRAKNTVGLLPIYNDTSGVRVLNGNSCVLGGVNASSVVSYNWASSSYDMYMQPGEIIEIDQTLGAITLTTRVHAPVTPAGPVLPNDAPSIRVRGPLHAFTGILPAQVLPGAFSPPLPLNISVRVVERGGVGATATDVVGPWVISAGTVVLRSDHV
jgi:hypothetical protein